MFLEAKFDDRETVWYSNVHIYKIAKLKREIVSGFQDECFQYKILQIIFIEAHNENEALTRAENYCRHNPKSISIKEGENKPKKFVDEHFMIMEIADKMEDFKGYELYSYIDKDEN